ncbi:MAG: CHASE2 domain-containing protein [Vulcanimicrobiaceae bacterium]
MRKIRTLAIAGVLSLIAAGIGVFLYFAPANFANANRTMDFVVVNEAMLWADDQDALHKIGIRFPERQAFNPHLKLVTIDEDSFQAFGPFPWPRSLYGKLLTRLAQAGAKTAAFDVVFLDNAQDRTQDVLFAQGLHAMPTVLGYTINTTSEGNFGQENIASDLRPYVADIGYTTVDNPGGWTLSQPFPLVVTEGNKQTTYLSLAGATVQRYTGKKFVAVDAWHAKWGNDTIPLDGDYKILNLPFRTHEHQEVSGRAGATEQFIAFAEWLPFYQALQLPMKDLKTFANGNIIVVGSTAQALGDFILTPNGRYPGVFSNLRFMDQFMTHTFIKRSRPWVNLILLILLPLGIGALVTYLAPLLGVGLSLAVVLVYTSLVVLTYGYTLYWLDIIHVDGAMMGTALFVALYRVVTEGADKRAIRDMFGKHVSPELVNEMMKHDDPKAALNLQGKRVKVTIFYSDIRGFTAMSEKMTPEQIYGQLNEYFEEMCQIVFKYNGYVDKFIGDCLMAVFSAPNPKPDDAKSAVFAAIEQQDKILEMAAAWEKAGRKIFTVGMGLNTGEVVMGNLGSSDRLNYTVIGDNVNTAARLYNVAKGGQTIISETTYDEVKDLVVVNELDPVMVKGKEKPLRIFEVIRKLTPGEVNPSKLRDPNEPVTIQMAAAH